MANQAYHLPTCQIQWIGASKSRWHWDQHVDTGTEELRAAYRAKVTADNAMHVAFEAQRNGR